MSDRPLGPDCTPECAEYSTGTGMCPGWTHPKFEFDVEPPRQFRYRVKVRRGDQWFDVGTYRNPQFAQKVAARWGTPGNAMVSSEPQQGVVNE